MQHPRQLLQAAAIAGLVTGLAIGTTWGEGGARQALPALAELQPKVDIDPLGALEHVEMRRAAERARGLMDEGRPWAAWRELEEFVDDPADAPAPIVLLAARAASEWRGWGHVRELLRGRTWLADVEDGEGLWLLGRGEEAAENWDHAATAYREYVDVDDAPNRGLARARLGRVLAQSGDHAGAAREFAAAADELGPVADWLRALQAEALAAAGAVGGSVALAKNGSAPARARQALAEARGWTARGDTARAVVRLEAEGRVLAALDASAAAEVDLERARLLTAIGRTADARALLLRVAGNDAAPAKPRVAAAGQLGELAEDRTLDEELARAGAYEAGSKPGLAAKALRAAIRMGADAPEARLRVGRLLFEERDYGPAREWLAGLAEKLDGERAAEAELLAARVLLRKGDTGAGIIALKRVVERREGTAAAGTASFILGEESSTLDLAIGHYRRASEVRVSPHAREALYRLGDRSLKNDDPAGAVRAWEAYVERYPVGDQTADAAYRAGRLHERAGRGERARRMYEAAIAADPVAYHAIRAADRLGADPLARVLAEPRPWEGLAGDAAEADAALRRLALLEDAGFDGAWAEELAAQTRRLQGRQLALLVLAEGLRDRGHTVEGIRIGRRLLEARRGLWDPRLLRVVFPFHYRGALLAEAERAKVDPYLLAGLVRQESSFNPVAKSWVGATGLAQIMPATGEWLAPGAGISSYRQWHLTVPEVSLRMGGRYLRDQLRRYDGRRDLALAAYNAGPGRADRWRRELPRDPDAFREAIPFAETRGYVRLVLRNAEVYRRLYGPETSRALAHPER